jgi:hypothetical protein
MYHYKVLAIPPKIGSSIDTNENIDHSRINRMSKLHNLFNSLYNLSINTDLPLQNIFSLIYPSFKPISNFEVNNYITLSVQLIKSEVLSTNFNIQEFRYFNDFVLEKVRNELGQTGLILPDRFKSHYFFESLSDCFFYCLELNIDKNCTVIEVEFQNNLKGHKMDNRLVVDFYDHYTARDFYNQAKKFLTKNSSAEPLYEVVFQGKYKILKHIPLSILNQASS